MKSWKEYPQLFIGSFYYKWKNSSKSKITHVTFYGMVECLDDCTLIARKINSLTEDEKHQLRSTFYDGNIWQPESLLYLLSIGVFPPIFSNDGVIYE